MKNFILIFLCSLFLLPLLDAQCISGNCINGKGVYVYPSGAKYIGSFQDGEIHGIGVCYYTDGRKYQGEWKHRYPDGEGTMIFPDSTQWTGSWKRGHPVNEEGEIVEILAKKDAELADDNIQSGCLSGDCQNGTGIFAYPDGSKYEGEFENGTPDGAGKFFFADGEKYIGDFQNGISHGQGAYYHANGDVSEGEWKEGEFLGNPIIEDGKTGCISGNCSNGSGTYIYKDGGAKYVGQFKNDMPNGTGAVYYANGERYVGEWKDASFNGKGILYFADGNKAEGYWESGTYMGPDAPEGEAVAIADTKERPTRSYPEESARGGNQTDEVKKQVDEISTQETPEKAVATTDPEPKTQLEHYESQADIIEARKAAGFKVWAVIVGVAAYNHMPTLRYTDDDAYRFWSFLKSPEGGALTDEQIRILIDEAATKQNIVNAMREVFYKAGPNDLIMLYFSGHGLKGSFLPIDYDGYNNKLPHSEISAIFDESKAKYKFCIADACHSGSLLAMKSGEISNTLESYYTTLAKAQAGTALLMSSKSDETSLESSGFRQGVFSHFLLRGLKGEADFNGDKIVTIKELYNFIDKNVRNYTGNRQSPLMKGDYDPNMTVSVVR